MKTYIFDTIERFKRYSQKLDVKTILCSKAWYVLNEDGDTENLIFQEDGYVLVSINGSAKKFTWNFIPQNQSLTIMHTDTDGTLLKPAFMDGKVLAFNKIGTKECMFLVDDSWSDSEKMLSLASMKKYLLDIENRAIAAELEVERKKKEEEEKRMRDILEQQRIEKERKLREEQKRKDAERIRLANIQQLELELQISKQTLKDSELTLKEIQESEWITFIKEDDEAGPDWLKEKREIAMGILFLCAFASFFAIIIWHMKVTNMESESSMLFAILMITSLLSDIIIYLLFYANEQKYNFRQYRKIYKKTMPKDFQKKYGFNSDLLENKILPLLHSYRNCKKYIENYPIYIAKLNKEIEKLMN